MAGPKVTVRILRTGKERVLQERFATLLVKMGKAEVVVPKPVVAKVPKPPAIDEATAEVRPRRRYRRTDLQAEE